MQVAIVGSPGSGKTVLTAVLSNYLSGHSDRVYMNPKKAYRHKGNEVETLPTISYINGILDELHNGKWAGRTEGGHKLELEFKLHIGGNAYDMKLLDSPGEDLQNIFLNYDKTTLEPFRQRIFDYILSSNVVILIVNLDHFADAPTLTARGENEAVIKEAVDNLVEAGVCHHILICFTAYDKYKAHIDQTYGGNFMNYLRGELPMFNRSCETAAGTVVHDYSDYGSGQKMVSLKCIAVAPVIAQRPAPNMNPDRVGKPPIGFDVRNNRHSWGMNRIADWLCACEKSERYWIKVAKDIGDDHERYEFIIYRISPIIVGALVAVIVCLVLPWTAGRTITDTWLFNSFIFGLPIGAGFGSLIGDYLRFVITGKDGFVFKEKNSDDEEQEESTTSRPTGTRGTSTAPPSPSGAGGTSTASPRPSGTKGTAATSGSETLD
jgi:GTPase SAR1 family protein